MRLRRFPRVLFCAVIGWQRLANASQPQEPPESFATGGPD
jgi:hypothetical protein